MTGYSARLVPGVYDVTVTPTELSQIPPYLSSGLTISADPSPLALTITYSRPSATNGYVSGRIIDADTQIAMPNVGVQAVDSSGRIVSNVQSTGDGMNGETGTFQLWISPGAPEDWSLQLISQPVPQADPNVAAGRLTYQLTRAASGAIDMYSGLTVRAASTLSLSGSVSGTCVACVDVEASLEGTNLAGMREAIASATVSLRADDVLGMLPAGHSAWFEARATSGVDGTFRARLMPGTYTAMITPPRDSSYAITSVRLEVTRSLRGQVLTVHQLVPVPGAIASSVNGSQAVRNTLIEAIPLLDPEATPNAAMPVTTIARRAQTYTEANGSFLLGLDEGEYILVAHPPDGSGLAAQIFDRFTVVFAARDAMIDPRPVPVNRGELMLSSPFAVTGFVSDSSANRIDGAGVRAFARYPVGNGLILDVEVARTTSTAGGAYTLLLPSTLVQQ